MDPADLHYYRIYYGDSRFQDSPYYNWSCPTTGPSPNIVLSTSKLSNFYQFANYVAYCVEQCRHDTGAKVEWRGLDDWIEIIVWTDHEVILQGWKMVGWQIRCPVDNNHTISNVIDWFIQYVSSGMAKL